MSAVRFVVASAFAFFAAHAAAQSTPENVYGSQPEPQRAFVLDTMTACYYKGIPYSEGSKIVEEGLTKPLECVRKADNPTNPLVWK